MQQNKLLRLHCHLSSTFIGNAVYTACQWGMLMVLAKFGSSAMVGQFALGIAITAPVFMLTNLQLRSVQITETKKQYCFSDYLGLRLISSTLALLVITIISILGGYRWETSIVIFLVGVAKGLESISDLFYGLIQQHKDTDLIVRSLIIKGLLSLTLLFVGVYSSGSILWGVIGLVFALAAVLLGYDIPNGIMMLKQALKVKPRWHLKSLIKLILLCLPLGLMSMLIALNTNIPRYFIAQYLGEQELGIFAAIAYLMVIGSMVVSALGESSIARLTKYYANQDVIAFRTLLLKLVRIAVLLGGIGVLMALVAGQQILTLLYQPEYAEQTNVFIWLMVAAGISYISSFLGYGMTATGQFFIQIPLFTTVVSISSIACVWLLPELGLVGAAIALSLAATVQAVMSCVVIHHSLHRLQSQTN
ncbi:lipopolysaccharide biosynthesis protein [Calothrix sp. PCC 7507]|uniref:lipopolysaccharide biosynthesis protein n=1 Tax=Calothrix sp. PCC 7507 TaxID=99598 RepID=UPI00029F24E9|nr:oligosaccharide flippase family protein [Calothrix sp. PCC 7507]AFY30780.1 polysaccharide biosynthesis protein [Calothrix sp. PCC 7507]